MPWNIEPKWNAIVISCGCFKIHATHVPLGCSTCVQDVLHILHLYVAPLVPMGCKTGFSHNPNKHIAYHFMWLFDSKLHETFPGINIDSYWCETCEDTLITHPSIYLSIEPICKQGCKSKFRLGFISIGLTLASSSPLDLSCLSLTHYLIGDKHLGCYSPPPLKESRPEIRNGRPFKEETRYLVPNICYSIQL
jgi:hypothetical protein